MAIRPQVSQGFPRGVWQDDPDPAPSGLHLFSFLSPGWSSPRGGGFQASLLVAKGQPPRAPAKSSYFSQPLFKDAKNLKRKNQREGAPGGGKSVGKAGWGEDAGMGGRGGVRVLGARRWEEDQWESLL